MDIRIDDLQGSAIQALLQVHLDAMYEHSPLESVHALDLEALRHPSITFWTAWESEELLGCGALKQLSAGHRHAAQKLYASEGFIECGPFADYVLDPYSLFITKALTGELPLL